MHVKIVHRDGRHDYIISSMLERYLSANTIGRFFRPLSKQWVAVGRDAVRGAGGSYGGPERRSPE